MGKICSIENCGKKHYGKSYCNKHYQQIYMHGKILERTNKDRNEFIIENSICWIILYNNKGIEVARAKIDTKYYESIKTFKWCQIENGYVICSWYDKDILKWKQTTLHQAIIALSGQEVPDGYEIDHKDTIKLNNLEENLRICTHAENDQNKKIPYHNTSGFKGVSWNKSSKKWEVQIATNKKRIHIGKFKTLEEAVEKYNDAAIKYHGEFAQLNNI